MLCFECGALAQHEHHVVPRSLGGTRTVPLCEAHHGVVHGHDLRTSALTKQALHARRASGRRTGQVPYGFAADADGLLVPNDVEQTILARAKALRQTLSLRSVVAALAAQGVVSPRSGRPYGLTQVQRLVRS